MGLFNKLFGSSTDSEDSQTETPWINLALREQLDEIVERSKTKTQFIFKHSTRCGISRMALSQFKKSYPFSESEADLYYLDLLAFRAISNAIAERFQVMHQSPQLLVIKNGVAVADESHGGINNMELTEFV